MRHVVVVGGGNAALCAAIAARQQGAQVTLLERAPEALAGGNSRFTAGAMRSVYAGAEDLLRIMPDLTAEELERTDFGSYSEADFYDDLGRVTQYRCDPDLAEVLDVPLGHGVNIGVCRHRGLNALLTEQVKQRVR